MRFAYGQAGEGAITRWLRERGNVVLPVYETEGRDGKGPRVFLPGGRSRTACDMLVWPHGGLTRADGRAARWVEAKHKNAFTWHRKTWRWCTGIDLRNYHEYCAEDDAGPWDVWLLFLHRGGQAKDSPANSPSGLYGRALRHLRERENHRFEGRDALGRQVGMVYWAEETLIKLAPLDAFAEPMAA